MNRLQKKCAMVTVGIHLLLVATLIVGPAFFSPRPKTDDLQILDVIPANLIDAAFNSGVRNAQPPPPAPPEPQPPQPPPPVATPPPPPKVETPEPVVKAPEPKAIEKPAKTEPHKIEVNTRLTTRKAPKTAPTTAPRPNTRAINSVLQNLKQNFSPGTTIDMPGNSTAAYANYAAVVKSVYERALILPSEVASDNENTKVTVTIASDGTVISSRIVSPSGDAGWDAAVQRTLDRVTFVAPFPEGAAEKERTYTINFNPQVERMLQ